MSAATMTPVMLHEQSLLFVTTSSHCMMISKPMRLRHAYLRSLLLFLSHASAFHHSSFLHSSSSPESYAFGGVQPSSENSRREPSVSLKHSLQRRRIQTRARSVSRKPKYYWCDLKNIRRELEQFWRDRGVAAAGSGSALTTGNVRLVIPNESLLAHYGRYDLRGAIASHGGRFALVEQLQKTELSSSPSATGLTTFHVMSGTWKEAVEESPELHTLIQVDPSLSRDFPPRRAIMTDHSPRDRRRWMHQPTRRPKGFWANQTIVIQELYDYVDACRQQGQRPSTWMPRLSELVAAGRSDLKEAIIRFGGYEKVTKVAGMIEYREWCYLEGQLELLVELKRYCDEHCDSDYSRFPCVSGLRHVGYSRLHSLIQYYGGRKFLAMRLGMSTHAGIERSLPKQLSWGRFDLEFALRLLHFIRADQMRHNPPLISKQRGLPLSIDIPTDSRLSGAGEEGRWLRDKIHEYGGHENVARRLGLGFSSKSS